MRTFLLASFVALNVCGAAVADPFDDALVAYGSGDYPTALRLFRPLAAQDNAAAQFSLGVMYDLGRGVSQDDVEAARWYRKAADQGPVEKLVYLWLLTAHVHDHAEAARWLHRFASQGIGYAQLRLGMMYRYGNGVPLDYVQAHKWLYLAAAIPLASDSADDRNDFAIQMRDEIAAEMTPDQITEAQKLAREWKPTRP